MTASIITIPDIATSDRGDELIAKARRISRVLLETLSSPDSGDNASVHFVVYARSTGTGFLQVAHNDGALERALAAVNSLGRTAFVVVTDIALLNGPGPGPSRQVMFHLCEPSGAQSIHLCEVDISPDGATLGAAVILRPGQTASVHYSVHQGLALQPALSMAPPSGSRLLN